MWSADAHFQIPISGDRTVKAPTVWELRSGAPTCRPGCRMADDLERKRGLLRSYQEIPGIPGGYIQATTRWCQVPEFDWSRSSTHGVHAGYWAEVYDGGARRAGACEAEPDPKSVLGQAVWRAWGVDHGAQAAYGPEASTKTRSNRAADRPMANGVRPVRVMRSRRDPGSNQRNIFLISAGPRQLVSRPVASRHLRPGHQELSRSPREAFGVKLRQPLRQGRRAMVLEAVQRTGLTPEMESC